MGNYDVPGVYIEEQTGPGVITGVGTSTAAFIGPALCGPMNETLRISSFDEFLEQYGDIKSDGTRWPYITEPSPFYLAHAVHGFFQNGGRQAYIVRVGTGLTAFIKINNQEGENVFKIVAQKEGSACQNIRVEIQLAAMQRVAVGKTSVIEVVDSGNTYVISVKNAVPFRVGDVVTFDITESPRAVITQIQGNNLTIDLPTTTTLDTTLKQVRIADIISDQTTFRLTNTSGLYSTGRVFISDSDGKVTGREVVQWKDPNTNFVTLDSTQTYSLDVAPENAPKMTSIRVLAVGSATVLNVSSTDSGTDVTVDNASSLRVGDVVTVNNKARATITRIQGEIVSLDGDLNLTDDGNETLKIANLSPNHYTFRVTDPQDLYPGGIVSIHDDANNPGNPVAQPDYAIIESVHPSGIVTLRNVPPRTNTYNLDVTAEDAPYLIPQEFRLVIIPPRTSGQPSQHIINLSLDPSHPRYLFDEVILKEIADSNWVRVLRPEQPPSTKNFPDRLIKQIDLGSFPLANGQDDRPGVLTSVNYQEGLNVLRHIDDVNLLCIPDASSHDEWETIQQAMRDHCLDLKDRFTILDSIPGALPSGPGKNVEEQRTKVQDDRGFAALYYPWIEVRDPLSTGPLPRTMFIPPSGHIAGVFARIDGEHGIHKAPANTEVRGVLGLERRLSDRQHGPLNLLGINVLRIFPGSAQVMVWGARTTVDSNITDWRYVNVRRLMLYIEESIEESTRGAVFKSNNLALWQELKRNISEFLTRVWRDGALFGETADKAFYVRIDEALNPPPIRAMGRLYIEIGVAPVRPAEFIIVRIGLWDGGAEVSER